jgi:hypothetical protein
MERLVDNYLYGNEKATLQSDPVFYMKSGESVLTDYTPFGSDEARRFVNGNL